MTQVLIRAELLEGLDIDGNAQVIIPYSPQTEAPHGRIRFIDPAAIVRVERDDAELRKLADQMGEDVAKYISEGMKRLPQITKICNNISD